jgi:hypothetical protein
MREKVEPDIANFRQTLMRALFLLGAISAFICCFDVGLEKLEWWLIPLPLLVLALRLRSLSIQGGRLPRLQRALCSNLLELLLIAFIVLVLYAVALWWFQSVPLNAVTLQTLREWDKHIEDTHKFIEAHTPKIGVFIVLLSIVIALRLVAAIHPALTGLTSGTTKLLAGSAKWTGRISTLVALAGSLTFLATQEGPGRRIALVLRDAKQDYEHFRSTLEEQTDLLLRRSLLERAWAERPPILRLKWPTQCNLSEKEINLQTPASAQKSLFKYKVKPKKYFRSQSKFRVGHEI